MEHRVKDERTTRDPGQLRGHVSLKSHYKEQREHVREKEKGRGLLHSKSTGKEKSPSHSNSSMHLSINQTETLCSSIMVTELVNSRSRDI